MSQISKKNTGFIALMSVIIISAILLLVATALGMSGFNTRLNILDSEFKERSSALAEACFDHILLEIANNPSYSNAVPEVVPVGAEKCTITDVIGSPQMVDIQANYKNYFTNLAVKIDPATLTVIRWEEKP